MEKKGGVGHDENEKDEASFVVDTLPYQSNPGAWPCFACLITSDVFLMLGVLEYLESLAAPVKTKVKTVAKSRVEEEHEATTRHNDSVDDNA